MNIINWNKIEQKAAKCSKNATSATNARVKRDPSTNKMHLLSKMHNNDEKKSAKHRKRKICKKSHKTHIYDGRCVSHPPGTVFQTRLLDNHAGANTGRHLFGKPLARCFQRQPFWHRHYSNCGGIESMDIGPGGGWYTPSYTALQQTTCKNTAKCNKRN